MSVDPDLRIALGFMLLLRCAIAWTYSDVISEFGIFASMRRNPARQLWAERVVWILLTIPVLAFIWNADSLLRVAYAVSPRSVDLSLLWLAVWFRWLLLVPATIGLLLQVWSRAAACPAATSLDASPSRRWLSGPFQIVRYPFWTADLMFFGALLTATDSWLSVFAFLCACILLRWIALPDAEQAWQHLLGDDYNEYRGNTGMLLPRRPQLSNGTAPQYFVPKRFGLPAIIALVTTFAVMFGILNAFQRWLTELHFSPILHLYFGLLLMLVWVAQMRFGHSARMASLIVGAVLLPAFVAFSLDKPPPANTIAIAAVGLGMLGGLIGYCMGAVAAGLFLVADWLGPYLPWSRKNEAAVNSGSIARKHGSPFDEPL